MRVAGRIAAALFAILATSSFATAKEWKTIRVGSDATYPPFESIDSSGKFVGFDIDILNAICDELKVKCEYINQDFDGIIPALVAGKFDVIDSSISITEERKKTIEFTDKYYNTPPAIVARKDAGIKGIAVDDLAGKAIGVQSSTTHANYAQKTYTKSDVKLYPSADQFKLDLISGRLDAMDASPQAKARAAQMIVDAREALREDDAGRVLARAAQSALGLADGGAET